MKKILISFPRAGTHLAAKILRVNLDHFETFNNITIKNIEERVTGGFENSHKPYSEEFINLIKNSGIKTYIVLRDPRDIIVSHTYWHENKKRSFSNLKDNLDKIPFEKRMDYIIDALEEHFYLYDKYRTSNLCQLVYYSELVKNKVSKKYTDWLRKGIVGSYKNEMTAKQIKKSTKKYEYLINNWKRNKNG